MKPIQVVKAYKAIQELSNIVLPYHASRGIAALAKKLGEEFETIATMEKNLVEEYGGVTEDTGSIHFPDIEATKEFTAKYKAIMEQDDDFSLPVVDLSKYVDIIRISASAMDALNGIVVFENNA